MAIELQNFLEKIALNFHSVVTKPQAPFAGGARLKRISSATPLPDGEDLGLVIASPNILRAFHSGFDPADPERVCYEGDFMDKIIYVTDGDYKASEANRLAVDLIAAGVGLLGSLADPEPSTGCSSSSRGTPVYRLMFGTAGPNWNWRFVPEPEVYTVVPAAFNDPDKTGKGMVATEYWIASDAERHLILDTPQHTAARTRSRDNCPSLAAGRRQRTLEQIARLRDANILHVFQTSRSPATHTA
ncbi:MAG: hypothetical protein LAP87_26945 [Acidobacteriia bacterium]|nr:hypothetical protein [Terriglobia bacterium]